MRLLICEAHAPSQVSWWLPGAGQLPGGIAVSLPNLAVTAVLIAGVSLLEAISIAKSLAQATGDTINADQELLGALHLLFLGGQAHLCTASC